MSIEHCEQPLTYNIYSAYLQWTQTNCFASIWKCITLANANNEFF